MLGCEKLEKTFKVVGIKHKGQFDNFGSEVPMNAQKFMHRVGEISQHTGEEIALFEPKSAEEHLEGKYYVGVTVLESLTSLPVGMDYIEVKGQFASIRGNINEVAELHAKLGKWINEKGYRRKADSFIIETYHAVENGEEVEIYIAI